jgi:hypothetical protein
MCCVAVHVEAHCPSAQSSSLGHALPHPPQLSRSTFVSMHDCPHWIVPPPQLVAQAPCEHTSVAPHALSHAPQLAGSL